MKNIIFDFQLLAKNWPAPIVARSEIAKFTGGLINPRTVANLDSKGTGPPRFRVGRKVAYPVDTFIEWLESIEPG